MNPEAVYHERRRQLRQILEQHDLDVVLLYSDACNPGLSQWIAGIQPLLFHYYRRSDKDF